MPQRGYSLSHDLTLLCQTAQYGLIQSDPTLPLCYKSDNGINPVSFRFSIIFFESSASTGTTPKGVLNPPRSQRDAPLKGNRWLGPITTIVSKGFPSINL